MAANFDSVARIYRGLEMAAFGGALARARVEHVERLAHARSVLLLGDGDGRFLARLLAVNPRCQVRSVDSSAAMLSLAAARVPAAERGRVTFERADVLATDLGTARYDAAATLFFLDCFTREQIRSLVPRIAASLQQRGTWLFADFALPATGLMRPVAAAVVGGLYQFFRWQAGVPAHELPPSREEILAAGCVELVSTSLRGGLLTSGVFEKARSNP